MNKVCLVTGGSRGIGKSTVREFAKNGFNVVINYVNDDVSANNLKKEVEDNYNIKALTIKCDISNELDVKRMVKEVIDTFKRIDVLVNNAGIAIDTLVVDKTVDNFRKILDTNLIGTFLVSREVSKYMLLNKCGSIVNIASTNAINTYYPESLDYDASKIGIISLTKNLALEYRPYIRVNCIAPGWTDTDMSKTLSKEQKEYEEKKIMLKRFAEPIEIAKTIYFIGVESTYMDGSIIIVDGGNVNV